MPNIEDVILADDDNNIAVGNEVLSDNNVAVDSGNVEDNVVIEDNNVAVDSGNVEDNIVVTDNNLAVDSGNTTDSYNDLLSNNDVDIEDSGNTATDSFNETDVDVDVDIDASDNSDNSDNSTNDFSDNYTDSFNDYTLTDESITVGVRQYNTNVNNDYLFHGAGAGGAAAAAAAGGTFAIDNRTTIVDQSVNQNIDAGDDVSQFFGQGAAVASGDMSIAAGGDVDVDNSVTETTVGDVYIGNEWNALSISDSFQDNSVNENYEWELEIEDSFNDESTNTAIDVDVEDAFNEYDYTEIENEFEWENSGNFFSDGSIVTDDVEL
ncbi:hypothetical protein FBY40_1212 [Microbacterium sp. SLBN-154]|uniref:hypothetical protein n=1 Tax=Microbacterium sp. SLBN-154 TaxID=2768458 RepID=UPI00114EF204|nr:hypothetical protein [Microbacterium sp. SLBN-154]TQK18723.1 hypothetical protein FBY40_1212 [Microbacterium sp. SLBN-154]